MRRLAVALLVVLACGLCHALTFSNAYLSPRNRERARRDSTQFIILHTTEGEAKPSLRKLSKNGEAHYCVDRNGKVYRIVDRSRVAYHCGVSMWRGRRNLDDVSIGIEVVGYHDRALTAKQYAALRDLILELQQIYGIKDANVMPHAQVAYGTPNRWHPRSHRGRKRCGMGYATPSVRSLLGLKERWLSDPDVKARRLVVGDDYLAQVLYAKNGDKLLPYKLPGAAGAKPAEVAAGPRTYVIQKGQTAWDIARDAYNAASTTYIFPSGTSLTGDKIKNWEGLVAGTKVILGDADAAGSPLQTLAKGAHPRNLIGEAVYSPNTWYIRPTGGSVQGSKLNAKTLAAMPPGTQILVGYARGGPVTSQRLPSQICPTQWDAPDTFYLIPGKKLQPSGDIDMRRVPPGTLVFYRN